MTYGSDTLYILGEKLRRQSKLDFSAFPQRLIEVDWGMNDIPVHTLVEAAVKEMAADWEMDMQQSDMRSCMGVGRSRRHREKCMMIEKISKWSVKRSQSFYNPQKTSVVC